MDKIFLPIDTKSLYYNIYNDNAKGHTCTVATPIHQGHSLNVQLNEVYKIPKQVDKGTCDELSEELNKNSKSINRINNVFIFDRIKVNNELIDTDLCFCMFVKEEIDPDRVQYGRTKLHYPISLKLPDYNVDNKGVLNKISEMYYHYAFIVEGFEYDFDDESLNFKILVVGYHNIPYTKVFINNKGVGSKFNEISKNYIDSYDVEIDSLRNIYGDKITPENFAEKMDEALSVAKRVIMEKLEAEGASNVRDISEVYPYSLYDIEYYQNGKVQYAIAYPTFTNIVYFNLSIYQSYFCHTFPSAHVFVVYNIGSENKMKIETIDSSDIGSYSELVNSYRYIKE